MPLWNGEVVSGSSTQTVVPPRPAAILTMGTVLDHGGNTPGATGFQGTGGVTPSLTVAYRKWVPFARFRRSTETSIVPSPYATDVTCWVPTVNVSNEPSRTRGSSSAYRDRKL